MLLQLLVTQALAIGFQIGQQSLQVLGGFDDLRARVRDRHLLLLQQIEDPLARDQIVIKRPDVSSLIHYTDFRALQIVEAGIACNSSLPVL